MSRTVRVVCALSALLICASAGATSFVVPSDSQMVAKSSSIIVGTVEGAYVRAGDSTDDAAIVTVYEVRVDRGIRGTFGSGDLARIVEPGGESAGKGIFVPGVPQFAQGEKVLLFLTFHKNHWEATDLMLGKFRFATTSRGERVLLRDTEDPEATARERSLAGEKVRTESGFLKFVDDAANGRPVNENYLIVSSGTVLQPSTESLLPATDTAVYAPESYTQKGASALGVRWDPAVLSAGLNYFRRTGGGSDIGTPDPGITTAMAAWNNECGSAIDEVLAGTTATAAGATNGSCGICDQVNVIEFNDPQGKIAGSWTGAGTIAVTFIVFNSVSTPNVGANFREILDADIVFQDGYNPSTNSSYQPAVTHEIGHSIGWRHSNASPSNPNDSANTCNSATEECATASDAIMFWSVNVALGATLQPWDIHAAEAVYPGGSCVVTHGKKEDFDGNGKSDILWRNGATGLNWLYFMNGLSIQTQQPVNTVPVGQGWSIVGTGDFDGDLKSDILWRNTTTGQNYIYLMNGATIGNNGVINVNPDNNWQVAGIGDFDGDGKSDIFWRNMSTGANYIYLMNGLTIGGNRTINIVNDFNWQIVGFGDLDGDGKTDVVWRNSATGQVYVYLMNGLQIGNNGVITTVADANWHIVGVADFDGDGKADLLWHNFSTGVNYIYKMNGLSITSQTQVNVVPDLNWKVIGTGDYDGDGKADILWRNIVTGQVYIYLMNGALIQSDGSPTTVSDLNWQIAGY